jgi:hypothetical protein
MASKSSQPARGAALVGGIFILMLGLGLLGNGITSLGWRVKALLFFKEGQARVISTEIYKRKGVFELETTYRLEWDGKVGKSTATLDPDDKWVPTREDAVARQNLITVGKLYPCWYSPKAPEANNVLTPDGLQIQQALTRLWPPLVVILFGVLLARWGYRGFSPGGAAGARVSKVPKRGTVK